MKATDKQVSGNHYKIALQPYDLMLFGHLNPTEMKIVKYITRYPKKNGIEDIDKAIHFIQIHIQRQEEHPIYFAVNELLTKISRKILSIFLCYITTNDFINKNLESGDINGTQAIIIETLLDKKRSFKERMNRCIQGMEATKKKIKDYGKLFEKQLSGKELVEFYRNFPLIIERN